MANRGSNRSLVLVTRSTYFRRVEHAFHHKPKHLFQYTILSQQHSHHRTRPHRSRVTSLTDDLPQPHTRAPPSPPWTTHGAAALLSPEHSLAHIISTAASANPTNTSTGSSSPPADACAACAAARRAHAPRQLHSHGQHQQHQWCWPQQSSGPAARRAPPAPPGARASCLFFVSGKVCQQQRPRAAAGRCRCWSGGCQRDCAVDAS